MPARDHGRWGLRVSTPTPALGGWKTYVCRGGRDGGGLEQGLP